MSKQKTSYTTISCKCCKKKISVKIKKRMQKFCSNACVHLWLRSRPEWHKRYTKESGTKISIARKKFAQTEKGKQVYQELSNQLKGRKLSPETIEKIRQRSSSPELVAKAVAAKAKKGTLHQWKGKRGGNGQLTPQQEKIYEILQSKTGGWKNELSIRTRQPRPPYPYKYTVDIGNRILKIAVEIDGPGHRIQKKREKDEKKEKVLLALGWTVLRFTNQQVDQNPEEVAQTILSSIASK